MAQKTGSRGDGTRWVHDGKGMAGSLPSEKTFNGPSSKPVLAAVPSAGAEPPSVSGKTGGVEQSWVMYQTKNVEQSLPETLWGKFTSPESVITRETLQDTAEKDEKAQSVYDDCPVQFYEVREEYERRTKAIVAARSIVMLAKTDPGLAKETLTRAVLGDPDRRYVETFTTLVANDGQFPTPPTPQRFVIAPDSKGNPPKVRYETRRPYGAPLAIVRGGATQNPVVKTVLKAYGFRWDGDAHGWSGYMYDDELKNALESLENLGAHVEPKNEKQFPWGNN